MVIVPRDPGSLGGFIWGTDVSLLAPLVLSCPSTGSCTFPFVLVVFGCELFSYEDLDRLVVSDSPRSRSGRAGSACGVSCEGRLW